MNTSSLPRGSTHVDSVLDASGRQSSIISNGKSTSPPNGRYFSLLGGAVLCVAYSLLVTARNGPLSLCQSNELLGRDDITSSFFQSHVDPSSTMGQTNSTTTISSAGPMKNLNINDRFIVAMDPTSFVDGLSDCIQDPNCHVLYHHVQKTGGTYLASTLYPFLNNNSYVDSFWCCHKQFMPKFRRNPARYCRFPLGVYEVWGNEFTEVVETCHTPVFLKEKANGMINISQKTSTLY